MSIPPPGSDPGIRLDLVIADDHPIFRAGLKLALEQRSEIGAVTDVATFGEILEVLDAGLPDLLIIDLNMPGLVLPDGLRQLRQRLGAVPILVLSASSEPADLVASLGAGASGFVTKASDIGSVFEAIRTVMAGGIHVPVDCVPSGVKIGASAAAPVAPRLTRRQYEVLTLALDGHANKEIAYRLDMSEGTVKTHLAAVMRSYDVNNRVQLLRQVERIGYRT